MVVRFDEASPDCIVTTDPYAAGPLLAIAVACVHGDPMGEIAVRARSVPPHATLVVERAGPGDSPLPITSMRVLPAVPPTADAVWRVAEQIGALFLIEPGRWVIAFSSAAG